MALNTTSRKKCTLLEELPELLGCNLPSLRLVLGLFLYYHLELHKIVRRSSNATVSEIAKFW